jgi:hypothetical protein
LKDVYILDTDPCPEFNFSVSSKNKLLKNIREFTNKEEFSDITFIVEGSDSMLTNSSSLCSGKTQMC